MNDEKICPINYNKAIGGQAIVEGVMMRGKKKYTIAVRNTQTKKIHVETKNLNSILQKVSFFKLPLIRGFIAFLDSIILGLNIIMKSSKLAGLEDELENEKEKSKFQNYLEKKFGDKLTNYILYFTFLVSIFLSIGIFIILPVFISSFFTKIFNVSTFAISIIEGFIRIFIFLTYIFLISQMNETKRLFMYHGAEHKTINCFEHGKELTIENVKNSSRIHKRCGTSFLVIVIIISMIVFMFLQTTNVFIRILSRIILVPLITSISYEIIKLASKTNNIFIRFITYPGLMLQKITTKEPDDSMIEVAILSLKGVLENEQ